MAELLEAKKVWGRYGRHLPCHHVTELRSWLETHGVDIWSERGEEPDGWVNLHCPCKRTYELTLRKPFETGEE